MEKVQRIIQQVLTEAGSKFDPGVASDGWGQTGGWVLDLGDHWSQGGGWYLVVSENESAIQVSRPSEALSSVTATVYKALNNAESAL